MGERPDVVIVGGGLAGLCCARRLQREGIAFRLLEASDAVGGRVRTDEHEGFLLDRGFQVLLTAYPECLEQLDYEALDLKTFEPGALVWQGGRLHRITDPWRRPGTALTTIFSPVGNLRDKFRVGRLRGRVKKASVDELLHTPERSSLEALREAGFTERMIERFFRPFLGGIFLDRDLATSSRMLDFVFKMFSTGDTALPARGMGAIPGQLAASLPEGSLRLGARVEAIDEHGVRLTDGERVEASSVVVATEGPEAARLLSGVTATWSRSTACFYFDAPRPPLDDGILVLNGEKEGPVNNLCVPSLVSGSYAPEGRSLISVTVVGDPPQDDATLEAAVRRQLDGWFGGEVNGWRRLRVYRIHHALPGQVPPALDPPERPVRLLPGLYVCGDHRDTASIQGAMVSGRRAAEALIEDRG